MTLNVLRARLQAVSQNAPSDIECPICFEPSDQWVAAHNRPAALPGGDHLHPVCLKCRETMAIDKTTSCPICRQPMNAIGDVMKFKPHQKIFMKSTESPLNEWRWTDVGTDQRVGSMRGFSTLDLSIIRRNGELDLTVYVELTDNIKGHKFRAYRRSYEDDSHLPRRPNVYVEFNTPDEVLVTIYSTHMHSERSYTLLLQEHNVAAECEV